MESLSIKTDSKGIPHVYDAFGNELPAVSFVVDYSQDTSACYISLTFRVIAPELDITGELLGE